MAKDNSYLTSCISRHFLL